MVKAPTNYGVGVNGSGELYIVNATTNDITNRLGYRAISPAKLNDALVAALTDASHITLTPSQKSTAQGVLGMASAYQLPIVYGASGWSTVNGDSWSDTDIIANARKVVYVYSNYDHITFPTLVSSFDAQSEIRTCEIWINVPVFGATVDTITIPNQWTVIGDIPTSLESDESMNAIYIFVARYIPGENVTYCEVAYSHKWLTSWSM